MTLPVDVPPGLLSQAELGPKWADWLDQLPRLFDTVLTDWELCPTGPAWHGFASLVAPVRTAAGADAVVKVTFDGDDESVHEAVTLQHWNGRGTVRLLRADPHRRALLLERLHQRNLNELPDLRACEVIAGFYRLLHVPALPQLRTVSSYVEEWIAAMRTLPKNAPIPHRLVDQVTSRGRELASDSASTGVIVHGDLHYENVLAADREPWLVIDPKPMSGDPHYEPAPVLWNRWEDIVATGNVRAAVRRRFHTLVDVAELDEERARQWVVVRTVLNAHWAVQDAQRANRTLAADEREWITMCVTIVKAMED